MSGTRVTATDVKSGESKSVEILNDYVVICDGTAEITSVQRYANGTVQLTIKDAAHNLKTYQEGGR